jgi:UDP-N-acetylglucosamine 4,6-dehydratase/5-epimerase
MSRIKLENELKNKTILITGGSGSVGSQLVKKLLKYPIKSIRVFDINEYSIFKLKRSLNNNNKIRFLLGSVLDKERLELAADGVDFIIHTAALKNIEITEYNPIETIDVNTNGLINLIKIVMKNKPKRFLNVSTDKAVKPTTLYGTTKLLSEKLISWAGMNLQPTKFGTIRLGNIIESKGNVFEIWEEEKNKGKPLPITDPLMKRYFMNIDDASNFILESLFIISAGEIIIPKIKEFKIKELALKISPKHKIIGIRGKEKLEEILLTDDERSKAHETKNMWIVKP